MGKWGAFDLDGGRCGNLERITEPSLVLYIFSFLDLQDVFKLRGVCKSWFDAVVSPRFLQMYRLSLDPWAVFRVRTSQPLDLELRYDRDHFDYAMKLENHAELWRPLHHPELRKRCKLPLGPSGSHFVGLCSSNGFVCGMLMEHSDSLTLAVGNPITNVWKTLPAAPIATEHRPRPSYLDIFMDATSTSSYQIVVLYQRNEDVDEGRIYVLQYESSNCTWQEGPFFSTENSLGSPLRGYAFFYTGEDIFPVYDPHSRAWSHISISRPARTEQDEEESWANWRFGYIGAFLYKGKYYWASILFDDSGEDLEDIGAAIWKLDQDKPSWVLVSRVLSKDLFGTNCVRSVGDKDMTVKLVVDTVFISAFYRKESHGVWHPVAYDFVNSKWYSSAGSQDVNSVDVECSYVIRPSLTATP